MTTSVRRARKESESELFLRRHGWVPFLELGGEPVWVGPKAEFETLFDAVRLEANKGR